MPPPDHPNLLPVPVLAARIRSGATTAEAALDDTLSRIDELDGLLNAVVAIDEEGARAAARAVDRAVAEGRSEGLPPHAGVPTLIKDLNNARGLPTTFGARSMSSFQPPFDDHAVAGIRDAGFVIVGKSNVPEIGSLPVTESLLHGPARNPWDPEHTPGGSSGGAAAAVAAGYVAAAHASDGGGSARIPASNCGVVGIKPSRGRVSHAPLFGDQVMGYATQGTIGRRVVDAAALLDAMHGYATGDPYHLPPPARPFAEEAGAGLPPLRIGLVDRTPWARPDSEVSAALEVTIRHLTELGHTVALLDVTLPRTLAEDFLLVWSASVAANPLPRDQLEPHNQAFAEVGRALPAHELLRAFTGLQATGRAFVGRCESVDAVLAPVLMGPPLRVGELDGLEHPALVDRLARHLGLSPVPNVTGQPAIALPVHLSTAGLPIGVQLIGLPAGEAPLIRLAAQLEAVVGWPATPAAEGRPRR